MNRKTLVTYSLIGLTAFLAACSTGKKTGGGYTPIITKGEALPTGTPAAPGTIVNSAGSPASYRAVSYHALPHWNTQHFVRSLESFKSGCTKLKARTEWQNVCAQAERTSRNYFSAKHFFERYFTVWEVSENGNLAGTITGYYEPVLHGDSKATGKARFPIYGVPSDFVSVELPANLRASKGTVRVKPTGNNKGAIAADGQYTANLNNFPINERSKSIKGRFVSGNRFIPYYTRAQINGGAIDGKAPILGYADDPVELFFLQIQGSGRLKTPKGDYIRLGYADKNEHPYVSIGRYMADKGYLPLGKTTMQGIKAWMQQNPSHLAEVLGQNPSYVFFRKLDGKEDEGPIGALGTPLHGEFAGAVDRRYITLGAPIFVATTHPVSNHALNRLIMAQDTGSAIRGAVRVDYFWGYGDEAGQVAGKMKHTGYVWQLLPNGVQPQYRP
ncbi:murein transglycosylase A [Neisseria wadsworthii]|uniref:peptidoglycan lytic exotransglycosylase n=1 Tax=Neisseria wadsworthii 9715 TaxID=1030841 RepID=G4CMW4_9NEIS|nr:murein transglycosylase A [Neisseria wadsworthii]EGZ51014.1 MltA family protein [Neisseria wadsworthii 9715]QMT36426.1 murein transglycosylase A [Neisseria wadsworthii]